MIWNWAVLALVMSSVELKPVSDAANRSMPPGAGGATVTVTSCTSPFSSCGLFSVSLGTELLTPTWTWNVPTKPTGGVMVTRPVALLTLRA